MQRRQGLYADSSAARGSCAALIVLPIAVNLLGCPEYSHDDALGFDVSFNALFHHGAWGGEAVDCRLEVVFLDRGAWDGFGGGEGAVTTVPQEAGSCAVSYFDRDTEQAAGSLSVAGSLEAGDSLWIGNSEQSLNLIRGESETGSIVYSLPECDGSVFPFAQPLDLTVPGSDTSGEIQGFSLEQAVGIGQDLVLLEPGGGADANGTISLHQDEDLELVWEHRGAPLVLAEIAIEPDSIVFVRNQEPDGFLFEAAACRLDDTGEFTLPAEVFEQLTPQPPDDPDYYQTSLQLDVHYQAGDVPTPWGTITNRRSRISDGGFIRLLEPQ